MTWVYVFAAMAVLAVIEGILICRDKWQK